VRAWTFAIAVGVALIEVRSAWRTSVCAARIPPRAAGPKARAAQDPRGVRIPRPRRRSGAYMPILWYLRGFHGSEAVATLDQQGEGAIPSP